MKNVLALLVGLVGILAVATSLTAEATSNSNSHALRSGYEAGQSGAAAVSSVSNGRAQKQLRRRAGLPVAALGCSSALSIDRPLSESSKRTVPLWLSELNQWRHMVGLHLVADNSRLSSGSKEYARYLIVQSPADLSEFRAYDRRIGPGAHLESSHSRSYTTAGAEAAIGGPLAVDVIQAADVAWEGRTE